MPLGGSSVRQNAASSNLSHRVWPREGVDLLPGTDVARVRSVHDEPAPIMPSSVSVALHVGLVRVELLDACEVSCEKSHIDYHAALITFTVTRALYTSLPLGEGAARDYVLYTTSCTSPCLSWAHM